MSKKKGMKRNEKIVILVLVIIVIALIIVQIVRNNSNNSEETTVTTSSSNSETESSDDEEDDGYVTTLSDGTKLNTSEKLNEDKEIDGIEITEIQLTESNNQTQLLATLTNTSEEVQGGYVVTINLLDEDGETIAQLSAYIPELEAGESTQLNASSGLDYSNAYNFTITK